jgi:hypothetical protein
MIVFHPGPVNAAASDQVGEGLPGKFRGSS